MASAPAGVRWGWGTACVPVRRPSRGRGVREGKAHGRASGLLCITGQSGLFLERRRTSFTSMKLQNSRHSKTHTGLRKEFRV